jgi:Predicted permeases
MIDIAEQIILLTVALFANALSAMAGGGAGLLQLPALIFLGLPFSIALATHKIATVALGAGATLKHSRERHLQLNFALLMLGCGLPGVILGARVILDIPEYTAKISLGILTIGLGIYSYLKNNLDKTIGRNSEILGAILAVASAYFYWGFLMVHLHPAQDFLSPCG